MTSDAWPQLIADEDYEAIIFDCDGTLVESSEAHFLAFQSAVQTQGHATMSIIIDIHAREINQFLRHFLKLSPAHSIFRWR